MKLIDVYNQLAYGELRQVALGTGSIDATSDTVPKENFVKLFPLVQAGLTELHKRFLLRERELIVTLVTPTPKSQVVYMLHIDFAATNDKSDEDPKYITDTVALPFENDLMRVERIYGTWHEKEYEIPLNQYNNAESIRTTDFNRLLLPDDILTAPWLIETKTLRIVYRADHPAITPAKANSSPLATEIFLPPTHLEALTFYIASRVLNPAGSDNEFHEGNNYMVKFEAAVAQLKTENFDVDNEYENDKLNQRGFV